MAKGSNSVRAKTVRLLHLPSHHPATQLPSHPITQPLLLPSSLLLYQPPLHRANIANATDKDGRLVALLDENITGKPAASIRLLIALNSAIGVLKGVSHTGHDIVELPPKLLFAGERNSQRLGAIEEDSQQARDRSPGQTSGFWKKRHGIHAVQPGRK